MTVPAGRRNPSWLPTDIAPHIGENDEAGSTQPGPPPNFGTMPIQAHRRHASRSRQPAADAPSALTGKRGNDMNDKDRRTLEAMDARELADIGISRSDLPRLYVESTLRGRSSDAPDCEKWTVSPARSGRWSYSGRKNPIIKAGAVVSAVLVTWAIVHAVAHGVDSAQVSFDDAAWPRDAAGTAVCTELSVCRLAVGPLAFNDPLGRGRTS